MTNIVATKTYGYVRNVQQQFVNMIFQRPIILQMLRHSRRTINVSPSCRTAKSSRLSPT